MKDTKKERDWLAYKAKLAKDGKQVRIKMSVEYKKEKKK
jgi:hypothetical protein